MNQQIETLQKTSKDNIDATLKAFDAASKGVQTIATEAADYAKKSFETNTAFIEKLAGAKSFDKALELQAAYVKTAFEDAVAQVTKMGELYAALAKDAYKPFEGIVAKAAPAAAAAVEAAVKQATPAAAPAKQAA
ncbi:phasin family protein [Bosea sp. MMO-172]|uniref:phasin family protein n=1 Tax=Bosea sp. MMO-172 TaxID=3127885 RepID=UPI0030165162